MSGELPKVVEERPARSSALDHPTGSGANPAQPLRQRKDRRRNLILVLRVALVIALIGGMYILNLLFGNLTMPSPWAVLVESWRMWTDGTMLTGLLSSLTVLSLGFLLAAVTGVIGGILLGGFRILGRALDPFVHAMNS